MCLIRRKLLLFDYIIGKLVEWEGERSFNELDADTINKILSSLTGIRLMKLTYFICLEDVEAVQQNTPNFTLEDTLFGIFNNHVAMAAGPAENTLYSNRSILLRFDFSTGVLRLAGSYTDKIKFNYPNLTEQDYMSSLRNDREEVLREQIRIADERRNPEEMALTVLMEKVDRSIDRLRSLYAEGKFPFKEISRLVDITHTLPLWNKFIRTDDKAFILDPEGLREEVYALNDLLN